MKSLVGHKIVGHSKVDWDFHGNGERVGELHILILEGGEVKFFLCEGGDTSFYAAISEVTKANLDDMAKDGAIALGDAP